MEREFIVSSKELRKNQERVLKAEAEAAEARKEFQINVIVICVAIGLLIAGIALIWQHDEKAINTCVKNGGSVEFCKANLLG